MATQLLAIYTKLTLIIMRFLNKKSTRAKLFKRVWDRTLSQANQPNFSNLHSSRNQTGGLGMSKKPGEAKMVSKNVPIALGIICIILLVGLLEAILQISSLNSKVNDLTDIANLNESMVWVNDTTVTQTASNYTHWFFTPRYAGYVSVNVLSSTTSNTYVRVIYIFGAVNYDNQISVGVSGTAVFPVSYAYIPPTQNTLLPPLIPPFEIRVGNTNLVGNATETVTVTYHY
jgi:hypothetical protein